MRGVVDRLLPSRLLKGSALVHAAAAGSLVIPGAWPWALATLAADHVLLAAFGLTPRSPWLGPNWTRLPADVAADVPADVPADVAAEARRSRLEAPAGEMAAAAAAARSAGTGRIAITIDDGPDPGVTPLVLAELDRHGARATFFCIGDRVARYPDLAREIVRRGHAVENHTQQHRRDFSVLGPARLSREIAAAQETIAAVCGSAPMFFRAPAGLRSPWLEPVLARLGLTLTSWTRRGFDTVRRDADTVLAQLARGLRTGDILLLHDGSSARTATGSPVILEVLPRLLGLCGAASLTPVTLRAAAARVRECGGAAQIAEK